MMDGGLGTDRLVGGFRPRPETRGALYGELGNDTIEGGGGNDTLSETMETTSWWAAPAMTPCTEAPLSRRRRLCLGGDGHDRCDGGPPRRSHASREDPDRCARDVETTRNCRITGG